jgi:hypothetical protein
MLRRGAGAEALLRAFISERNCEPFRARLAADLVARYGDRAEEIAFAEEYRAWRYSDVFEQRKWRCVRLWIEGRSRQRDES